jgi:hypothetical protein
MASVAAGCSPQQEIATGVSATEGTDRLARSTYRVTGEAFPERLPTSYRHIRAADVVGIENSL